MTIDFEVLNVLQDGKFHSGEELAKSLHVSRARIWQGVKSLREMGLEVAAVTGRGYKIFDGIELLDKTQILKHLPAHHLSALTDLIIYPKTTSTNSVLLEGLRQKSMSHGTVCLAEYQTQGRGRLGRQWESPLGSNIYCSMAFQLNQHQLMGLSLVIGIAIVDALNKMGAHGIGLKWPNDIFYDNKKLGGILVEITGDALGPCDVVVGFGLNLCMRRISIDAPFTDLETILQRKIQRNALVANLIAAIYDHLELFKSQGFAPFLSIFPEYDVLYQQPICFTMNENPISAIALGIDPMGQLQVNVNGEIKSLSSAQVSVKTLDS